VEKVVAIVARLRIGYSTGRLYENKFAPVALGTLDDGRGLVRVVAQATKKQGINDCTRQVYSKTLTTLDAVFLLRGRCSERSGVAKLAGVGLDEYRREDIATMRYNESVSAHIWRHGRIRTLARRCVQVSGEKETNKEGKLVSSCRSNVQSGTSLSHR
jgi:hypothetical protein